MQDRNNKKAVLWNGKELFLKFQSTGEVQLLGAINTYKGRLTKSQKLKAVRFTGQWVEL